VPRKLSGLVSPSNSLTNLGREPEGTENEARNPPPGLPGEEPNSTTEGFPLPGGVVLHGDGDGSDPSDDVTSSAPADEGSPEESSDKAEEALEEYARTPREYWEEDLKSLGLSATEAAHILDKIMTTGLYFETYKVGGAVIKLRTRTTSDADRLMEILQDQKPETTGVYSHLVTRVNLAASLVQYGKNKFTHTSPTDDNRERIDYEWRERYRFCAALPSPAFYAISQLLQKFDEKVTLACDARSVENF